MSDKASVVQGLLAALADGDFEKARSEAQANYPFELFPISARAYTLDDKMKVFRRDGFVDRYSGQRLVLPGALRLLSRMLPADLPFHRNWKMSECHIMYYELCPTIDHIRPIARRGVDLESNWVTTSMLRNSAKSNWLPEELGWTVLPDEALSKWDGLTKVFTDFIENNPAHLDDSYIRRWHNAAIKASAG